MSIAILEKDSDLVLAKGEKGEKALKYEGNWYFDPEVVDQSVLQSSPTGPTPAR